MKTGTLKGRGGGEAPTKESVAASSVRTPSPPPATAGRALVALTRRKTLLAINQTQSWPKPSQQ